MKPPFDPDYGKTGFALHLFRLRFRRLKLSQRQFSNRFGIGFSTIRDVEQGKTAPTRALRVLVEAIARDPVGMAKAAQMAGHDCECEAGGAFCRHAVGTVS
jgi:transcriptional regulator with XRE-family HTH domain